MSKAPSRSLFNILVRKNVNDSVYIEIDIEKAKKIRENDEENNRFPKILWRFIHMKIEDFAKSRQMTKQKSNGSINL